MNSSRWRGIGPNMFETYGQKWLASWFFASRHFEVGWEIVFKTRGRWKLDFDEEVRNYVITHLEALGGNTSPIIECFPVSVYEVLKNGFRFFFRVIMYCESVSSHDRAPVADVSYQMISSISPWQISRVGAPHHLVITSWGILDRVCCLICFLNLHATGHWQYTGRMYRFWHSILVNRYCAGCQWDDAKWASWTH